MNRLFEKHFWKSLFFSYLAILAFALFLGVALFRSSLHSIERIAVQFNQVSFSQVTDSITNLKDYLRSFSMNFLDSSEYISLSYATQEMTNYKLEKAAKLQSEIVRQIVHNSNVSRMYIWFGRPGVAVSSSGFYRGKETFDRMLRREFGVTQEEIVSWYNGDSHILRPLGSDGFADQMLAVTYDMGNQSFILMELRDSAYQHILLGERQKDLPDGTLCWAFSEDSNLTVAPKSARELSSALQGVQLASNAVTRFSFQGNDLALMQLQGDDFTLISACDYNSYAQTQQAYITLGAVFLGVYLVLGMAATYFMSRQAKRPIQRLSRLVLRQVNDTDVGDLAVLEAGINSLLRYSQDYEHAKTREEKNQREHCLQKLLLGQIGGEANFGELCRQHGLDFPTSRFVVVGVAITDYSNLFFDRQAAQEKNAFDIAMLAVSSIAGELLGERVYMHLCQLEGRLWVVGSPLQQHRNPTQFHIALLEASASAEAFIREKLGIKTSFYVGELSKQQLPPDQALHAAYLGSQWGLEQMESYAIEQAVADRAAVEANIHPQLNVPIEDIGKKRRELFSAVTTGDMGDADRIYLELRKRDMALSDGSFATLRAQNLILMQVFISSLPSKLVQCHREELEQFLEGIRLVNRDDQLLQQMHDWMEFVHKIWSEADRNDREAYADIAEKASRFIISHYTDPELSVAYVAERLSVNPSYLSRAFHKKYDGSVLDYIHRQRVDAAKVLIRESGSTLEHVAAMVGYSNTLTLIRAFKRIEGCTPTEYRHAQQEDSGGTGKEDGETGEV